MEDLFKSLGEILKPVDPNNPFNMNQIISLTEEQQKKLYADWKDFPNKPIGGSRIGYVRKKYNISVEEASAIVKKHKDISLT